MAPPKRQRTTPTAAQSTLSFNRNKPGANRVSKASPAPLGKPPKEPIVQEIKPEPIEFPAPAPEEEDEDIDEDELRASKILQKQINAYWAEKERARKTPRVHQKDLSLREKILREFDMSSQYGPCIGISRLDRWKRARDMELGPPIEVLAVMVKAVEEEDVVEEVGKKGKKGGKGNKGGPSKKGPKEEQKPLKDWQISVMDELSTLR